MQAQLAGGYVGQTVKIVLGKASFASRVAYIDCPATAESVKASLGRGKSSTLAIGVNRWPGAQYGRLRRENLPSRGPLSYLHYQNSNARQRISQEATTNVTGGEVDQTSLKAGEDAESHGIVESQLVASNESRPREAPEYYKTERGELLSIEEHRAYHEARQKNATYVSQAPVLGSMPTARRNIIESSGKVLAADHDLKLVTSKAKMLVASLEASNLKPSSRAIQNRVSQATTAFVRDTCPPLPRGSAYVHPNDRLDAQMELVFGRMPFALDDIISIQRTQKQVDGDPSLLLPPLTIHDVENYETTAEGIRDALETRWSKFFETAGSQRPFPTRSPIFRFWDRDVRLFYSRLAFNLQFGRKEEIVAITEQIKPFVAHLRKANPHARQKRADPKLSSPPSVASLEENTPTNETWPLAIENPEYSQLPPHLDALFHKSELARSVVIGLALIASSTLQHPTAMGIANLISNLVLQPLGYSPLPTGAHLLLTHLGMPIVDSIDIPYLYNLVEADSETAEHFLRPYPWALSLIPSKPLEQFAAEDSSAITTGLPTADLVSNRQLNIPAASPIPPSMCAQASSILLKSIETPSLSLSQQDQSYIADLVNAGRSPKFSFSKNRSERLHETPSGINDSSLLLSHFDLDKDHRIDLSGLTSYAIDDKSTTEVDDAFAIDLDPLMPYSDWIINHLGSDNLHPSLQSPSTSDSARKSKNHFSKPPSSLPTTARVLIHIADPTTVMRVGDDLELGARKRVETMYLPHRKSFMLPSLLSEFYCSLQPHPHKNLALTFEAHISLTTGEVVRHDVYPSKFTSMKRVTYDSVQNILKSSLGGARGAGESKEEIGGDAKDSQLSERDQLGLKVLFVLSQLRRNWRMKVGKAETMSILQSEVKVTNSSDSGAGTQIEIIPRVGNEASNSLVEEMMVMVGEITARTATENNFSVPFRSQPIRSNIVLPNIDLTQYPITHHNPEVPTTLGVLECAATRMKFVSDVQSLMWMNQSNTSAIAAPHLSLGLPSYARASSPLRRYADIIAHFQLKAWGRHGGDLSKMPYSPSLVHSLSQHINCVSKDIKFTQQFSERWWKSQYVLRHAMDQEFKAIAFAPPTPDPLAALSKYAAGKAFLYSFFILGLDLIVQLPTPVHLEVGQIVTLKPVAASELNLDWTVVPF